MTPNAPAEVADVLAQQEDALVSPHGVGERALNGLEVGDLRQRRSLTLAAVEMRCKGREHLLRSSCQMRDVIHVEDVRDARLSDYSAIDPRIPRRDVERAAVSGGYAICEGPLLVRRTLETDVRVRSVLVTPSRLAKLADILENVDAPVYVAEKAVLEEVVGYAFHRGAVASVERPVQRPLEELLAGARRVAVCEGITDHENLGSIFRNAAAFGLDAVLLDPTTCDPLYRRSIRVSMGHALRMPWARVEPWPDGLDRLRALGLTCVALTPGPGSIVLDEIDRPGRSRSCSAPRARVSPRRRSRAPTSASGSRWRRASTR